MRLFRVLIIIGLITLSTTYAQDERWLRVGMPALGSINQPGAEDVWLFDGIGATTTRIRITALADSTLRPTFTLYYPDGRTISGNEQLETRLPASGTYRIVVTGADDSTGRYEIVVLIDAPPPPPSTRPPIQLTSTLTMPTSTPPGTPPSTFVPAATAEGQQISIGETVTSSLQVRRWDTWRFQAEAGQHITIRMRSSQVDPFIELYSPSNLLLYSDDDSGLGRNATLYDIELNETGTYRLLARSYGDEGAGTYFLSVEPNAGVVPLLPETPRIEYNQRLTDELQAEETHYYFEGTAGDRIAILLSSNDFDPYLELRDSDAYILRENDDNGRNRDAALVGVELPTDGPYFITVATYNIDEHGTYQLEVLDMRQRPRGGDINIGQTVNARLLPGTTAEWTFQGTAGQIISLAAMPTPPDRTFNLIFEVLTPDGTRLVDDGSGFENTPAMTDWRLEADGEYTIRLRETDTIIGGNYLLTLAEGRTYFSPTGEPGRVVALEGHATSVLGTIDSTRNRYQLWVVTATDQQPLSLILETGNESHGTPLDFDITVMDINWTPLETERDDSLVSVIETSDDYLILVEYNGSGIQTYQLTLQTEVGPDNRGEIEVGQTVADVLPIDERHAWQFTASQADIYRITMTTNDSEFDPYLYVLDQDGEILVENDDAAGNLNPRITLSLQTNQTITIIAASFGDLSSGRYELFVEREP